MQRKECPEQRIRDCARDHPASDVGVAPHMPPPALVNGSGERRRRDEGSSSYGK